MEYFLAYSSPGKSPGYQALNPNNPCGDGCTPLSYAASSGSMAVVEVFLNQKGIRLDLKDKMGRTALSWMVEGGHEAVVKLLLQQGANILKSRWRNGRAPLSCASTSSVSGTIVRPLLNHKGIQPDLEDTRGRTPLSWAAEEGNEVVVKLF
jgi:ankyrin repeat protein